MAAERVEKISTDGDISRATMTKSAGVVAFFTALSRITGLLRDTVATHLFGASAATDAFVVAFRIPNMMRRFVAEGALTVAFIPVYTDIRKRGGEEEATEFYRATLGLLSVFLVVFVTIGVLLSSVLVYALASGFDAEKFALTTSLTQITFPYVFFISLVGLFMGALNARGHFAVTAFSPVLLNIGMILGALYFRDSFSHPMMGQAVGVLVGGVLQLAIHVPILSRHGLLRWPTLNYKLAGVVRLGKILIPALLGVAAYQINLVVLGQLASHLPDGQVTYYYNADRLMQLALGIFAISIATAALPTMSAQSSRGEMKELMETWSFSNRLSNFITIPAAVGLTMVAIPITSVLWRHGIYTWEDVQLTAYITMAFAPGLVAISMMRNTVQVFYALEDMKSPVWVSLACLALNLAFGVSLLRFEVVGLATAFTLSSFAQMAILIYLLRRKLGKIGAKSLLQATLRQVFSATSACALAWVITQLGDWTQGPSAKNVVVLLVAIVTAIVSYAGLEFYFGSQEAQKIWALVRSRIKR